MKIPNPALLMPLMSLFATPMTALDVTVCNWSDARWSLATGPGQTAVVDPVGNLPASRVVTLEAPGTYWLFDHMGQSRGAIRVYQDEGKEQAELVPDFKGAAWGQGANLELHIHARSFEPMAAPPSQKRLHGMATGRYYRAEDHREFL